MKLSKVLSLLSLLILSSCSFPEPEKRDIPQNSSFFIDSVTPTFTAAKSDEVFSVNTSRDLNIQVCIKDNRQSQAVSNHQFRVAAGNNSTTQDSTTDLNGCLNISENITFNPLATAKEIILEKNLIAQGFEKGSQKIKVMINPWSGQTLDLTKVTDIPRNYVNYADSVSALRGQDQKSKPFVFDGFRFTVRPDTTNGNQRIVHFDMTGKLLFESEDSSGQKALSALNRGRFNLQYTLFYENDLQSKTARQVIYKSPVIQVREMIQGSLFLENNFNLSGGSLCRSGTVYIGLSLEPIDNGSIPFQKTDVLFYYGTCETRGTSFGNLASPFQTRFQQNSKYTVDEYIAEGTPAPVIEIQVNQQVGAGEIPPPANPKATAENQSIEIRPLEFKTLAFESVGGSERVRKIQVTACFQSGWDRAPLRNASFDVTKFSGEKRDGLSTNDLGCFRFDDEISFRFFSQECWITKTVVFSHKPSGFSLSIPVFSNPWDANETIRDGRAESINQKKCAIGSAQIVLDSYQFAKSKFEYKMDDYLNLELEKVGNLRVTAKYKRPSLLDPSGWRQDDIPPGMYWVRLAVVDQTVQSLENAKNKIYFVNELALPVRTNSQILEQVLLATRNLKAAGNTNQLWVEVLPLKPEAAQILQKNPKASFAELADASNNIAVSTYRAPLMFSNNVEGSNFIPVENQGDLRLSMIQKLMAQYQQDRQEEALRLKSQSQKQHFADRSHLTLINLNSESETLAFRTDLGNPLAMKTGSPVPLQDLRQLLDSEFDREMKVKLCAMWYGKKWTQNLPGKSYGVIPTVFTTFRTRLISECQRMAISNIREAFDVETKYFLTKPTLVSMTTDSVPYRDFSIAQGFSMSNSQSETLSQSLTWSVGADMSYKFFNLINASTGLSYSLSRSTSETTSHGTSTSYSGTISLGIETLKFNIAAEQYEKCVVIKPNLNLFLTKSNAPKGNIWTSSFRLELTPQEKVSAVEQGYLLCDGAPRKQKLETTESYYVLNQNLYFGHMIDIGSESSRPFFAFLRGETDFVRFLSFVQGSSEIPSSFQSEFQRTQFVSDHALPVFLRGLPTWPGVVTKIEK